MDNENQEENKDVKPSLQVMLQAERSARMAMIEAGMDSLMKQHRFRLQIHQMVIDNIPGPSKIAIALLD